MRALDAAQVEPGTGIVGDRYATGLGYWSYEARYVSEITFVDRAVLGRVGLSLEESRRNVVTEGMDLPVLIGATFAIGDAVFAGERPCDPCAYLDGLLGRPVRAALGADGGLRARVVRAGIVRPGDAVRVLTDDSHDGSCQGQVRKPATRI